MSQRPTVNLNLNSKLAPTQPRCLSPSLSPLSEFCHHVICGHMHPHPMLCICLVHIYPLVDPRLTPSHIRVPQSSIGELGWCMMLTGAPGWCMMLAERSGGLFGWLTGASNEVCWPFP
ncbi:hypothetical protein AMTRI_Chr03g47370 [Amborella trichopoda]